MKKKKEQIQSYSISSIHYVHQSQNSASDSQCRSIHHAHDWFREVDQGRYKLPASTIKISPIGVNSVSVNFYCNTCFPCSAASVTLPAEYEVKLVRSFPLEKKFPVPVTATRVVFGSSAASFSICF